MARVVQYTIPADRRLIAFRKGELTLEFDPGVQHISVKKVGHWVFVFTTTDMLITDSMSLEEGLRTAETYAETHGYLFIRLKGQSTDLPGTAFAQEGE